MIKELGKVSVETKGTGTGALVDNLAPQAGKIRFCKVEQD